MVVIGNHILHVCKQLLDCPLALGASGLYAYHVDGTSPVTISLHMGGDLKTTEQSLTILTSG